MKYMTFNSSCAFAGVANMLLQFGIDVEDRQIALGMELPYLFDWNEKSYLAGPMLQEARWFNLYLNTLGFAMQETAVAKIDVMDYLRQCKTAMLGIHVSPKEKHAIVLKETDAEGFVFINNKWEQSDVSEKLCFSEKQLLERLDDMVMVAKIERSSVQFPDFLPLYHNSCAVLENLKKDIWTFCSTSKTKDELVNSMNCLFRPILLDAITMLELIEQDTLAECLRSIQKSFLNIVKTGKTVVLAEVLDLSELCLVIDEYSILIQKKMR